MRSIILEDPKPYNSPSKRDFPKTNTLYLDLLKNTSENLDSTLATPHSTQVQMSVQSVNKTNYPEHSKNHETENATEMVVETKSKTTRTKTKSQPKTQTPTQNPETEITAKQAAHSIASGESEVDLSEDKIGPKTQTDNKHHEETDIDGLTTVKPRKHTEKKNNISLATETIPRSSPGSKSQSEVPRDPSVAPEKPGPSEAKTIYVKRLKELEKPRKGQPVKSPLKSKKNPIKLAIKTQPKQSPKVILSELSDKERRTELLFQYEILRKLYPDAKIAPLNRFAPMSELESEYETVFKKIEMATTVDKSKKVFVMVLLAVELFLGKLGLDMNGFTIAELNNMESYNDVLYELGKKYSVFVEAKIAPELKLAGLLMFSIIAHLISRTLESSGSETVAAIVKQSTKHTFSHLFG